MNTVYLDENELIICMDARKTSKMSSMYAKWYKNSPYTSKLRQTCYKHANRCKTIEYMQHDIKTCHDHKN